MIINKIETTEYQGTDYDFCLSVFSRHPEAFKEIFNINYGLPDQTTERKSVKHFIKPPYSSNKIVYFHSKFGAIWFNEIDFKKISEFVTTVPNIHTMFFGYICGTFSPLGPTNMKGMLSANSADYYEMWIQCSQF